MYFSWYFILWETEEKLGFCYNADNHTVMMEVSNEM